MSRVDENPGAQAAHPAEVAEFSSRFSTPGVGVLTVSGELDISTAGALQHALEELFEADAQRIEVDLSGVVFMDSSALSALVGAHERATKLNHSLALVRPSPPCAKVLGITGLDRVFELI